MNTKQKLGLTTLAVTALAVCYWTGFVHGSSALTLKEKFISVALPVIFLWTLTKLVFAFCFKRDGWRPSGGDFSPPAAPGPMVPVTKPPGRPPVIHCEHAI